MSKLTRPITLSVDLEAIKSNTRYAKQCAPTANLLACVKADAYGHGMAQVAESLASQVDAFGVASLDEALTIKNAGIESEILLLEGCFDSEELAEASVQGFWITVHSRYQLEQLAAIEVTRPLKVWLKMDTGMHRLGFSVEEYPEAYAALVGMDAVDDIVHMSHFASSEELDNPLTQNQMAAFEQVAGKLSGSRSLANSAAILSLAQSHQDWVRPGLMLYGVSPFSSQQDCDQHLQPAMTMATRVIAIQNVPQGESVGYNQAWTARTDSRIAVAAVGYGDGYPRNTASGTPVLVDGARARSAGHVAMDMMLIDVTELPSVSVGAPVELWGKNLSIAEVATCSGYSPYELMTRVTSRAKREYFVKAG